MRTLLFVSALLFAAACGHKAPATNTTTSNSTVKSDKDNKVDEAAKDGDKDKKVDESKEDKKGGDKDGDDDEGAAKKK